MTFVWNITCRRLQSSGALARFAEGAVTDRQRNEINTHLSRCPACRSAVADALAVADLLRSTPPDVASASRAFTGNLWASLESEIARTPQDAPINGPVPSPVPSSGMRLQRVGSWLATPGAMPFGTVAAAAVVGMAGIAIYQRVDVSPLHQETAAVTARHDSDLTEIKIIPPLPQSAAAATEQQKKPSLALSPPRIAAQIATAASPQIAPLRRKVSVRRSVRVSGKRPFRAPRPAAPRPPAFQMASAPEKFSVLELSPSPQVSPLGPSAPSAATPTVMADASMRSPEAAGFVGSGNAGLLGGSGASTRMGKQLPRSQVTGSAESRGADSIVDSAAGSTEKAAAGSVALTAKHQPGLLAVVTGSSENHPENLQDGSAVRSVMDMALQQRRQRSLFSYATR